ncbi:E3 ubiquitin-protein ligase SP1-like isoform X2 [Vicia villosa]|nr:E3 ubiquitin-protein ligase SP1-like isoform X2 [Vicia villosa]XP_058742190.1 E3 ubiquitin-protein ligase SP1-like isoform X2 [Vicia villosa]
MAKILFIGGIACCAAAPVFSIIGRAEERNAEILKSVTRVRHLKDLAQLLDAERSPLVVTVSGNVVSETPIECQMTRLSGVIVVESVEKLILQKDDATERKMKCKDDDDSWTLSSKIISSIPKEVPWYLDDGTDRVCVVGARDATGFVLPVRNSTFKESGEKIVLKTFGDCKPKKTIGFKRIERVLPVGTSLNVVGEASKDDDGTVRIQRPRNGPFYVSSITIDEHTTKFLDSSRWYKKTSEFLTVFGASIIVLSATSYILEKVA